MYKNLLIITEATFSDTCTGMGRTLMNLFKDYPADKLLVAVPDDLLRFNPASEKFKDCVIGVKQKVALPIFKFFPAPLKKLFRKANSLLLMYFGLNIPVRIREFQAENLLICTGNLEGMLLGEKLLELHEAGLFIYIMDDLRDLEGLRCGTEDGLKILKRLYSMANGLIMISEELKSVYSGRYGLNSKKILVAHNPVEINSCEPPASLDSIDKQNLRLAYAGAIWPMHSDALLACAQAVKSLSSQGIDIKFTIYTEKVFWEKYKSSLEGAADYAGFIPYESIGHELSKADLLVSASTFNPCYIHLSYSSLQTKLTDYMSAAKPILSIGPEGCASSKFVSDWRCGIVCPSVNKFEIENMLKWAISNKHALKELGLNGFFAAKENFTCKSVNPKLYSFLSNAGI